MFDLCMQRDATSFVEIPEKKSFGYLSKSRHRTVYNRGMVGRNLQDYMGKTDNTRFGCLLSVDSLSKRYWEKGL